MFIHFFIIKSRFPSLSQVLVVTEDNHKKRLIMLQLVQMDIILHDELVWGITKKKKKVVIELFTCVHYKYFSD